MHFNEKNILIIAGVHKGATTSLYEYMIHHPDVCAGRKKEIHYYTPLRYGDHLIPFSAYENQFKNCHSSKYIIDASPSYLYGKGVIAHKIREDFIDAKIIIILREPTSRIVSFYKFIKSEFRLNENITFTQFIDKSIALSNEEDKDDVCYRAFREGCYAIYLEEWLATYGDSLKVIFFDHIKENPQKVMRDICSWLDIDDGLYDDLSFFDIKNMTRQSKYKSLYKVSSFFNQRFGKLLRDYPKLKKLTSRIYFAINEGSNDEVIPEIEIVRLNRLYSSHNRNLVELLTNHGYSNLPVWLSEM